MALAEEVVVRMGLDTRPLSAALRGVRSSVTGWANGLRSSVSSAMGGLLAPLTGAGLIAGLASTADRIEKLRASASALGVGVDFYQDLQAVARQSGLTGDAVEAMMKKFIATVPVGKDVQQAFFEFADKLASITDPAARAQFAIEALGRAGVDMVKIAGQGAEAIKALGAEFAKFSDAEMEAIDAAKDEIEKAQSQIEVFSGRFIGALAFGARVFGKMSTDWKYWGYGGGMRAVQEVEAEDVEERDRKKIAEDRARRAAEQVRKLAEGAAAAEKYAKKLRDLASAHGTLDQRITIVSAAWREESKAARDAKDEVQKYAHATKAAELAITLDELRTKREKERLDRQKELNTQKEKELSILERINDAAEKRYQDEQSLLHGRSGQWRFTLQDLANLQIGRGTTREMAGQITTARQIMWTEAQARQLAALGHTDRSRQLFDVAEGAREGLNALLESDRYPFRTMEQNLIKSESHLAELLRKAGEEGLNVVPSNAE